jgi:DNA-binding CsgD family transcriptional regulator
MALPGIRQPSALGPQTPEIKRMLKINPSTVAALEKR